MQKGRTIAPIMMIAAVSFPPKPIRVTRVGMRMMPILMLCLKGVGPYLWLGPMRDGLSLLPIIMIYFGTTK